MFLTGLPGYQLSCTLFTSSRDRLANYTAIQENQLSLSFKELPNEISVLQREYLYFSKYLSILLNKWCTLLNDMAPFIWWVAIVEEISLVNYLI